MNNILELDEEELTFIRNRYPDIDTERLLEHLPGMEVLTYLDKLETMIKNDIDDLKINAFDYIEYQAILYELQMQDDWPERQYTWNMLFRIQKKISHYRKYGSRYSDSNLPKEFSIEDNCRKADELARKCIGTKIGATYTDICIERLDETIRYLKTLGIYQNDDTFLIYAIQLGTKLGELMLEDKLKEMDYEWHMDEHLYTPVIKSLDNKSIINPIGKIFKMLTCEDDEEGTCKDFYKIFLFMIQQKNRTIA